MIVLVSLAFLQASLKRENYYVEVAYDGVTASMMLREASPSLVLLDLLLPHKSGAEILQQIRTEPRLKNTKVVVVTANIQLVRSLSYPVDATFTKPLDLEEIRRVIAVLHPDNVP